MSFPLFHRPGAVVFLDDDAEYLEMLALVLPARWHVELFIHPQACINYLQQEPPLWEADAWAQQQMIDDWHAGKPLIPRILEYWRNDARRYALTRVCVFDYSMPGMDGLQALGELADWPGSRVLLTGQADEQVAVTAFNRGMIDQFIPKQVQNVSRRLVDAVDHLMASTHPRHAQIWRSTLQGPQEALLRVPSVARDLQAFAGERWTDHIVLGSPFGVLGLTSQGRAEWLQLEQPEGLPGLAELAESQGLGDAAVTSIRSGHQLVNLELQQALQIAGAAVLQPAFSVGRDDALLGAMFEIPQALHPGVEASRDTWLAQRAARSLRE